MKCSSCKEEAEPGKQKCAAHLAEAIKRQQNRSAVWVAAGLCDRCGKRAPDEGHKRCVECRSQQNKAAREYQRALVENRICVLCCERTSDVTRLYCSICVVLRNKQGRDRNQAIKLEIFNHYGGPICACCGETQYLFLSLDHINNDGAVHRKDILGRRTGNVYEWVRRNNFPPIFQVLCMNCNFGKRMNNGICPHKEALAA